MLKTHDAYGGGDIVHVELVARLLNFDRHLSIPVGLPAGFDLFFPINAEPTKFFCPVVIGLIAQHQHPTVTGREMLNRLKGVTDVIPVRFNDTKALGGIDDNGNIFALAKIKDLFGDG